MRNIIPECWMWQDGIKEIAEKITEEQLEFMRSNDYSLGAAYIGMITVYEGSNYKVQIGNLFDTLMALPGINLIGEESTVETFKQYHSALAAGFFKWLDKEMSAETITLV